MIMDKGYLDEIKEHIEVMQEGYFVRRGLTKERVLNDKDTMERLWTIYQKDVEEYGCDREFSRDDALNEVFGSEPRQDEPKYRCPFCGSKRFIGHQRIRADVYVGEDGAFDENLPGGLEAHIYDSERPYGPFTCDKCGHEFNELPEYRTVSLARGTFTVVSGMTVREVKKAGYGYHHEDSGYTVVGNGKSAVALSNADYDFYYSGRRSFTL